MTTALGLIGIAAFILGMLVLSASVTYSVVKADEIIRKRLRSQRAA